MTLDELQQIKDSLDKGVIVSKATWLRVLDAAITQMQMGLVGWVCEVDGKQEIIAAMPSEVNERLADRLLLGAMVIAPGSWGKE